MRKKEISKKSECLDTQIERTLDWYEQRCQQYKFTRPFIADTVNDLSFGFEFEFVGIKDSKAIANFTKAMKQNGIPFKFTGKYGKSKTNMWVLGTDGSVHGRSSIFTQGSPDEFGYELTSPVIYLNNKHNGMEDVRTVLSLVKEHLSGYVNSTCGGHVHIGSFSSNYHIDDILHGNVQARISLMISMFSKMTPYVWQYLVSNSRMTNKYCSAFNDICDSSFKYLSLSSRLFNKNGTVECRLHHGTLDADEIIDWAKCLGYFIIWSTTKVPKFHVNTKKDYKDMVYDSLLQIDVPESLAHKMAYQTVDQVYDPDYEEHRKILRAEFVRQVRIQMTKHGML